jgi:1A family penicillin-binding protein
MSSRLRRERDKKGSKTILSILAVVGALILVLLVAGAGFAYAYVANALKGLPDANDPNAFKLAEPTKIYSADGKLLANFYLENRDIVPIASISTDLQHAVVAVEDERFYQHNGVDFQGILRALIINLTTGSTKEGASTLTQQYIRNTILANERYDITVNRKIREMYLAYEFEKLHTKQEVLADYLNTVYYGDGAYGAEAAALTYFGEHASQLSVAQAAMLAGLPQSPIRLNPYYNMEGALARQRWVLGRMVANGYITPAQAAAAQAEKITLKKSIDPNQGIYDCAYFVSYVRKQLLQQYGDTLVFKGGLKVYTTIDTKLQRDAEKAVHAVLPLKKDPDSALISIVPRTGRIVAMYGGRDYKKNSYNFATQGRRQPGSSFKTFVLVTALEKGIPPRRAMDASSPARIPSHPVWIVNNSEGSGKGFMTISNATRNSVNCVFARLIWELGADEVATTAKRMGITSPIPALPSIALGSAPVSPLEMASAYGTLANNGVHVKPVAIDKILDQNGATIYEYQPAGTRVITPQIAWATTQQLMGVVSGGTGTAAHLSGREVAGKTGTAQNYQDAWFVGYTPQLVTAVWMGYSKGSIPMRSVHGLRAFGGTFAAPIWHKFMLAALRGQPVVPFPRESSPHYIWKASWSQAASASAAALKPKPKPPAHGGGTGGGGTGGGGGSGGSGGTTSTPPATGTP